MGLRPEETELVGHWKLIDGRMTADSTCERIQRLVSDSLEEVASDESGWSILYRDPVDGRYWELTYPQSHMHGGGPPSLLCVLKTDARMKYGLENK